MAQRGWLWSIVMVSAVAVPAHGGSWTTIDLAGGTTGIRLEAAATGERVVVEVAELRLTKLAIEGGDWAVVEVPGAFNLMERGRPSLPFVVSEYVLDAKGGIRLELETVDERVVDLATLGFAGVAPSKGPILRTVDPATVPWAFDPDIYESDKPFPGEVASITHPFIAGPLRGQALRIPVARWSPRDNTLRCVEKAIFRVVPVADAANPRTRGERPLTSPFLDLLRSRTLNPERATGRDPRFTEAGRLAILAAPDLIDAVRPLAAWEQLVGYPTVVSSTSDVGADIVSVKTWLQNLYDAPDGLTWVILVGDYAQIPNPNGVNEGAPCDPCYAKLEGDDNRPDVAISRLSAQTPTEVTVQVEKILAYEASPDVGSAAAWYATAFGIASDQNLPPDPTIDWERMNQLRDVLLPYAYTEFTELYDGIQNPTSTSVAAAVNQGRGLGLYIGHGSDTSWVTSGFSVSDVNSRLTNDGMLPVIWDVACLNGRFNRTGGDCFAEAWMKKAGGGAVSFEAATTSESWVPPCVAQRAIVDAVVEETAFTAGAQHLAAKLHLMDVEGDGNSSEGTMWTEQSHLFGAATLWPRTAPPVPPDEPADYALATGVASLTVTVGGVPLTVPGRAIVSFLTDDGGSWNLLGSGLIDGDGRVEAAVSGEPTHCHIHGRDLVPQLFELAARPEGRISLDATAYACDGTAVLQVADSNVPGASAGTIDVVSAELSSPAGGITVELTETAADSGFYRASVPLAGNLTVAHGDSLVATYSDADPVAEATATATLDCAGPTISGVEIEASADALVVSFATDEPAASRVLFGTSAPVAGEVDDPELRSGPRSLTIDGVSPCTDYLVEVAATDAVGNLSIDNHGGAYWSVTSAGWAILLDETFDTDPGWTIVNGGSAHGWQFGQPQGLGGEHGSPDPSNGASGANVYGVNLAGDYDNNVGDNQLQLVTPSVDCSLATSVRLGFQRWLGVEQPSYDHARVQVSADGGPWATVWENQAEVADGAWAPVSLDLTLQAAGHPDVRIRWTLGSTDTSYRYCGWNLDDVVVEAVVPCSSPGLLFHDGFETGACDGWSLEVQ